MIYSQFNPYCIWSGANSIQTLSVLRSMDTAVFFFFFHAAQISIASRIVDDVWILATANNQWSDVSKLFLHVNKEWKRTSMWVQFIGPFECIFYSRVCVIIISPLMLFLDFHRDWFWDLFCSYLPIGTIF